MSAARVPVEDHAPELNDEWVQAVNAHGGFGRWSWDVTRHPGEIWEKIRDHVQRSS
jgi:hypothetical protein